MKEYICLNIISTNSSPILKPFVPNAPFLYTMFSGGTERVHWEQMG